MARTRNKGIELSRRPFWLLYILPGLALYLVFMALPLANSLRLSFYTGSGFQIDDFIGFDNYRRLFFDPDISAQFWNAFRNTWVFFGITMLVQNSLGLGFALLLSNKNLRGAAVFRTLIFIPATIAIVVCGFLWKLLLDPNWGSVNLLLQSVGLGKLAVPWLGLESTTLPVITLVSAWEWMGIPTMIFLAALQGIPDDYFEAAQIDGASGWQVFRFIKLPLLLPMVGVVSILTFTGNFNAFDIVYAMAGANGAPNFSADILGTYFYRTGIAGKHPVGIPDMGLGAAVATIIFIVLLVGVVLMRRFSSQDDSAKVERR
jgi:raffinose/stachyose/melibiose transport system permease protein